MSWNDFKIFNLLKDVADAFKFYDSNLQGENMDLSKCRPKPNFATGKEKNYRLGADQIAVKDPFFLDLESRSGIHESDARCCGPTTGPKYVFKSLLSGLGILKVSTCLFCQIL